MSATAKPEELYNHYRPANYWAKLHKHSKNRKTPQLKDVLLHLGEPMNAQFNVEIMYIDDLYIHTVGQDDVSLAISSAEAHFHQTQNGREIPTRPYLAPPVLNVVFPALEM
jgi:hypothetical protein